MSRLPDPNKGLLDRIRRLEEQLARMRNSTAFYGTGIHPDGDGGMTVEGRLNVTSGEVQSGDYSPGAKGWHLGSDGKAEFKDVTLYDIPNSMLANPVTSGAKVGAANGTAITTASVVKATASIPVPVGFTVALVRATAVAMAVNSTAELDYLYCDANINGVSGGETYNPIPAGVGGSAIGFASATLTGLSGGNITLTIMARTSTANWSANPANQFNIHGEATFLR